MRTQKHLVAIGLLVTLMLILFGMGVASAGPVEIDHAYVSQVITDMLAGTNHLDRWNIADSASYEASIEEPYLKDGSTWFFQLEVGPDFSSIGVLKPITLVLDKASTILNPMIDYADDIKSDPNPLFDTSITIYEAVPMIIPTLGSDAHYGQMLSTVSANPSPAQVASLPSDSPLRYGQLTWASADAVLVWGENNKTVTFSPNSDPESASYWETHVISNISDNYPVTVNVALATEVEITLNNNSVPYDGITYYGVDGNVSNCSNQRTDYVLSDVGLIEYKTIEESSWHSNPINAGEYQARLVAKEHFVVTNTPSATLTINKAELTAANFTSEGVTYDGKPKGLVAYSIEGIVDGSTPVEIAYETLEGGIPVSSPTDAGEYKATLAIKSGVTNYVWSGGVAPSYEVLTIYPAELTAVNFGDEVFTYDGSPKGLVAYSIGGIVDGSTPSSLVGIAYETQAGSIPVSSPTDAGDYKATLAIKSCVTNYVWSGGVAPSYVVLTINPADLTALNFDPEAFGYDGSPKGLSYNIGGIVDGSAPSSLVEIAYETLVGGIPVSSPADAGSYKGILKIKSGVTNYVWLGGTDPYQILTVDPRPITATHSDMMGLVYDGSSKAVTWTLQNVVPADAGIMHQEVKYQNDVGYPLASDTTSPINAGTYTSTVFFSNDNYVWQAGFATSLQYTIAPYDLSVTPDHVDCEWYQTVEPVLTYVHGAITVAMKAPVFSGSLGCPTYNKAAVGNYPITQGTLDLLPSEINDNYTIVSDTTKLVTVKYHIPSDLASVIPAVPDGDNGWYKTKVVVSAPAGYSISQSENSGYAGSLSYNDGITYVDGFSYYLRKLDTNATTNVIRLPSGFKQDTTAPTLISYGRGSATADRPEIFLISAADNLKLWKAEFYRGGSLVETDELSGTVGDASYAMYAAGTYIGIVYDDAGNIVKTGYLNVEDADGDGLPDAWETALGTKPDTADTDGDGLSDGDEVLKHHTDPLATDTDGDRLPDGLEVGAGLAPLKTDSNGDGVDDYVTYTLGYVSDDDLNMPLMARMLLGGALGDGRNQGLAGVFADAQAAADALNQLQGYNFLKPDLQSDSPEARLKAAKKSRKQISVVQLDINAGAGVGVIGDYLVTFSKDNNSLALNSAVSLIPMGEMPSGSELVALASDDGSIVLMGYWNATEKKIEGSLWVSAPKAGAGKLFEIAGSQGATAFDIARDGSSVAYIVDGKINKLYLTDRTPQIVTAEGSANTLQYVGGDLMAVGADGSANKLEDNNTLSATQVDEYDLRQRTNNSRSRIIMVNGEPVQVDTDNAIHVSSNRSRITFLKGDKEEIASTVSEW